MTAGAGDLEDRVASLEGRLRRAEDHLEILSLIGSYGPVIDSGWADQALDLYADDGAFHQGLPAGGFHSLDRQELHGFYAGQDMQDWVAGGCSHFNAVPSVRIDGDTAQATNFSIVLMARDGGWIVSRAAINDWRLVRRSGRWRIQDRYNHPVDGSAQSHDLMRRAVQEQAAIHPITMREE